MSDPFAFPDPVGPPAPPTPVALSVLLANSRVVAVRNAAVASLGALFPDIQVLAHLGKLDMADVLSAGAFTAPSIHVAAARVKNEDRTSGDQDFAVHFRAYIVAEEKIVGGLRYTRDEIGYALMEGLLAALEDVAIPLWTLSEIGLPEDAEGEPLFTMKSFEKGTAFYIVTWRQTLYASGQMLPNLGGQWSYDEPAPAPPSPTWIPGGLG